MAETAFPWQEEGEEVFLWGRRHFFFLLLRLTIPALLLTVPLYLWLSGQGSDVLPLAFLFLGPLSALLILWFYMDWQDDYWALSWRRLVHVTRTYLLYEQREEMPLGNIQSVELVWPSMFSRLIGYGELFVQSAGQGEIVLSGIPQPDLLREELLKRATPSAERVVVEKAMAEQSAPAISKISPPPPRRAPLVEYFLPRLRVEEEGKVTWRKHWYILLQKMAGPLAVLVLVLAGGTVVALDLPLLQFIPPSAGLTLAGLLAGLSLFLMFYQYDDWRNDVYVLTLDRIIDIDKKPFFLREERREASLGMVQDVRYVIPGFLANLLNTGNVIIETAAKEGSFTFDWVHDPRRVQQEIFAQLEAFREREREKERQARLEEVREILAAYRESGEEGKKPEG
ncbi:MAG: hypothetical protein HYX86_05285 [Chloroflexi bacterium]|nr:hypothetical protein [Chloroflexota bacterium]